MLPKQFIGCSVLPPPLSIHLVALRGGGPGKAATRARALRDGWWDVGILFVFFFVRAVPYRTSSR